MEIINQIVEFLSSNIGPILTVMSVIMVVVAKIFPNANAPAAIAGIQKIVDMGASIFEGLGKLCKALSNILAQIIKSDGFLGKK
jgi:hypothetical protein